MRAVGISGWIVLVLLALSSGCDGSDPLAIEFRPLLVSPPDGAVLDNGCGDRSDLRRWEFRWTSNTGAERFHLLVQHTGSPLPLVDLDTIRTPAHVDQDHDFVADANRLDLVWQVRVMNGGRWGPWSQQHTFDVEPLDTDCP